MRGNFKPKPLWTFSPAKSCSELRFSRWTWGLCSAVSSKDCKNYAIKSHWFFKTASSLMSHCHLLDVLKTVNNIQTRLDQVLLLNIGTKITYGAGRSLYSIYLTAGNTAIETHGSWICVGSVSCTQQKGQMLNAGQICYQIELSNCYSECLVWGRWWSKRTEVPSGADSTILCCPQPSRWWVRYCYYSSPYHLFALLCTFFELHTRTAYSIQVVVYILKHYNVLYSYNAV